MDKVNVGMTGFIKQNGLVIIWQTKLTIRTDGI